MKSRNSRKQKNLEWWASIATVGALIIALIAWLLPDPINLTFSPTPIPTLTPTTIAEGLGITEAIPPREAGTFRILVAKFDETNPSAYRVTDAILSNLKSAMSDYSDTEVIGTDQVITEQEGSSKAIKIGKAYDASIVIWGWYGLTDKTVPLGIHFDVVPTSNLITPTGCAAVPSASQLRNIDPRELSDFTMQTNLSQELSYVTILTLGITRFNNGDLVDSIKIFDNAIERLDENTVLSAKTSGNDVLVNTDLLYFYRAGAYFLSGNYEDALSDMDRIKGAISENPVYQLNLGQIYVEKKDFNSGLQHLTHAINYSPPNQLSALAYYLRGIAYSGLKKFDDADKDFQMAFKLDDYGVTEYFVNTIPLSGAVVYNTNSIDENPNNFAAYYFRGLANEYLNKPDDALKDYTKAIEIYPDFYIARQSRAYTRNSHRELYDANSLIQDYEYLSQSEKYHTPCNTINYGVAYDRLGNKKEARRKYNDVISLASNEIERNPSNAVAYYYRGLAYSNLKMYIKSLNDLKTAREIDPTISSEYKNFDSIYEHANKYSGYLGLSVLLGVIIVVIAISALVIYPLIRKRMTHHTHHTQDSKHHHTHSSKQ